MDYIYDIETFPNVVTLCVISSDKKIAKIFEISGRKNQLDSTVDFLRVLYKQKARMVGFNNIGFDYPVLHHILEQYKQGRKLTAYEIYLKAMSIIQAGEDERFSNTISEGKQFIKQVDLYKIHHFDNKAKATSLKMLEFNMKSDDIEDLPFPVGKELTSSEIDVLLKYNAHDVLQTHKFYLESLDAIKFREQLSEKYGKDFINHNDTKIGKDYFIMRLEESNPGCCYKRQGNTRVMNQTKRDVINVGEIILPYIKYTRPEFKAVKDWFSKQTITETKGVFSDILEHDLGELAKYAELTKKKKKLKEKPTEGDIDQLKKENPSCWVEEVPLKSGKSSWYTYWNIAETLNVVVDGFRFDYGTGGIHGSIESSVVKSDDDFVIVDLDVASYYPNLAIVNGIYPEHLGENFCTIYKDVYEQRKLYQKGSAENAVMKLALNGVYGDSNNQYSPFYDPQYTMTITINGQLLLCMLAEKLMDLPDMSMVQANTDGITVRIRRKDQEQLMSVVDWWQNITGLQLERNDYSMMCIADVNSYIAVFEKGGKIKRKGRYEYDSLGWHQNHSSLVIPKAAERALVYGEDIESFIRSHQDKYDFMLRTKVPRSSRLVMVMDDGYEVKQQNICRYYISTNGGRLVKIMPPLEEGKEERRIGIDKEWKVKTCNDISKFNWDVDYDYYIQEANKLVESLKSS